MRSFQKILSVMLAVLILTLPISAKIMVPEGLNLYPRFPFEDVPYNSWYFESVLYCRDNALMNGTSYTVFAPNKSMTRAEFATLLGRLDGATLKEIDKFPDVKQGSWYSGYVGWAVDIGIFIGYSDGKFHPTDNITREQMTTVLARYIKYTGVSLPIDADAPAEFKDIEKVAGWAKDGLEAMRTTGLIKGDAGGNFNPKNNMSRAEAATIVMRLDKGLITGSLPETFVYSAYALNCNTFFFNGTVPVLYSEETYPVMRFTGNTIEFDLHVMLVDPDIYPVIRLIYKGDDVTEVKYHNALDCDDYYWGNYTSPADVNANPKVSMLEGYKTVCVDLRALYDGELQGEDDLTTTLKFTFSGDGLNDILAIGFFRNTDDADISIADIKDNLLYDPKDSVFFEEIDDKTLDAYLSDADKRKDEILNTKDIDPATISGTCYYISEKNGNDNNDGLTPETAWKSTSNLIKSLANGLIWQSTIKTGDAVFFERGGIYRSPEIYTELVGSAHVPIVTHAGVTYAAYGEGAKPVITSAVKTSTPAGTWVETEYKNVWCLVDELPTNKRGALCNDIGNISINGGELYGVKVIPDSYKQETDEAYRNPYGADVKTVYIGTVTNGRDVFESGNVTFDNYGALRNNLEYFHDLGANKLYMYYDGGNPGKVFDDVMISANGDAVSSMYPGGGHYYGDDSVPTVFDNLAFMYNGSTGINSGCENQIVQNCEIGWNGGSIQGGTTRYGGGVSSYGDAFNWTVKNCYIYQSYDEHTTVQCMSGSGSGDTSPEGPGVLERNITIEDCVMECATAAYTAFNWGYPETNDPYLEHSNIGNRNLIDTLVIRNNYILYNNFGFGHTRAEEYGNDKSGSFLSGPGFNDEHVINSVFENNVCLYSNYQSNNYYNVAAPNIGVRHGMQFRNNVYLMSTQNSIAAMEYMDEGTRIGPYARVNYGEAEGFIAYLQYLGIESGSKFYYYEGYFNEQEAQGAYH